MRLPVKQMLPFAALILIAGCAGGGSTRNVLPPAAHSGPAADYPMVIGQPFTISGVTYTPTDKLNSDEVGYASVGEEGGAGVTAAHKTLPLPSYAEVTSLATGKTILVRIERRGPMTNDHLIELSPGAAAQLGIAGAPGEPVRVRRVNPPESERAALRGGGRAPDRMDTPKGLLAVLMRKLESQEPATRASAAPPAAAEPAPPAEASSVPATAPAATRATSNSAMPAPSAAGAFIVQVAAFSTEDRAKSVADKLNGKVSRPGRYWLTRLGPFATHAEAEPALAKARAAGYSDARILRAD